MTIDDFDFASILTQIIAAVIILIVTAVLARLVKSVLSKQLVKIDALRKQGDSGTSLGVSLATVASLVIWLFGLVALLNLFELTSVVGPIQELLGGLLGALPGIIGAALLFLIGFILARVVREIVTTALQAAGADRLLDRAERQAQSSGPGSDPASTATMPADEVGRASSDTPRLSVITGQLVFALILIVVSISALQVLGIRSISEPATEMLNLILQTIPLILAAAILLAIGYLIGRFVAPLLESTLRGLGVDRALADVGVPTAGTSPSTVISRIAHVAIVLFFAIAATRVLGFDEVTAILDTVLEIGGQVVFGGAVIAAGVLIANVLSGLASGQAAQLIRWATIGLFVAIGLQFMGLADTIVTLAFGSVVVGAALAAAIAFGLGGRDAAARQLARMQESRSSQQPSSGFSPGPSDPPTS